MLILKFQTKTELPPEKSKTDCPSGLILLPETLEGFLRGLTVQMPKRIPKTGLAAAGASYAVLQVGF